MEDLNISFGISSEEREKVSIILYEAFSKKLNPVFGSKEKSLKVFSKYLDASHILVVRKESEIVGVAGLKYDNINWLKLNLFDAIREFGLSLFRVAVVGLPLVATRLKGDLLLDVLAVSKEARGQGVGTKLLAHTIAFAKKERLKRIRLYVIDKNERAKQLYERMGFYTVKHHKIPRPWSKIFGFDGYFEMTCPVLLP
ncbi:GNAT family N-acetyltransferase [Kosmotoga pacifica]|uniref:GNAT family N-acetyltransferase n=1 Tax=Kosmotoga pacifica TaxID=1330330 RepID=UPI00069A8305|nr:GNAT family N-acetyltransferase [Kosmotoga pacifica]